MKVQKRAQEKYISSESKKRGEMNSSELLQGEDMENTAMTDKSLCY